VGEGIVSCEGDWRGGWRVCCFIRLRLGNRINGNEIHSKKYIVVMNIHAV